jgi:hypothetical protein
MNLFEGEVKARPPSALLCEWWKKVFEVVSGLVCNPLDLQIVFLQWERNGHSLYNSDCNDPPNEIQDNEEAA